ncbi:MAG: peptidylprolyl isomerase [Ruminococcus sp.]|nr:peptidylprolyl isomerase [Ruminococcus sp.]
MIKKIIAVLAALTLSAAMLTSCGNSESSNADSTASPSGATADSTAENGSGTASGDTASETVEEPIPEASLTIDGEKVDTTDLVMCTIDGDDITFDLFRYYYFYVMGSYGYTAESLKDEETFKTFKEAIAQQFKRDYTTIHLARENNLELGEEGKKNVQDKLASIKANYESEEAFQKALAGSYLTEAVYTRMLEIAELYTMVESQLLTNEGKYATSKEDFRKIVKDNDKYSRVIHILIPYYSQADITDEETLSSYESMSLSEKNNAKKTAYNELSDEEKEKVNAKAKEVADEVLKKAKEAETDEDFKKLITEYGWDPGMEQKPDGYYLTQNSSFVKEFREAAFELKENEVSDLIENTNYGWFIIKRLPVDMDYVESNIESMILEYDTPTINDMFNKLVEELEFKESETMKKMTADSIT